MLSGNNDKFILGAHYFVPGFSEKENWETDFERMKDTGISCVHAIAAWSRIHVAQNIFDFDELEAFLSTAERYDINVQLGLVVESAPEWVSNEHPDWLYVNQKNEPLIPYAKTRFQYGGWPGVCFDNKAAKNLAAEFIKKLGGFAKNKTNISSIEAWSGISFPPAFHAPAYKERFCYCKATTAAFVEWLKNKYGQNIENLNETWKRKFTDWKQINPPRFFGTFPNEIDWSRFLYSRQENMLKWRVETLREAGFTGKITAHTGLDDALQPQLACDDHACAALVDEWGFTNAQVVEGKKSAYLLFFGADYARSAARGKPFNLSQLRIGPFAGRTMQKEAGHSAGFVRLNNWAALAGNVKNICYRSWRPQTSGHEAEGYGLTTLTGELNDRTEAVLNLHKLTEKYPHISSFKSAVAETAILILPESAIFNYVTENGSAKFYESAVKGAYKAFFDRNILVDFVRIDQINNHKLIYMPWPLMLNANDISRLAEFVKSGGVLISEACPGKFNSAGCRNASVPPGILKEMFGCVENDVAEMITDLKTAPVISGKNKHYPCANMQSFLQPTTGTPIGYYLTSEVAVVDNKFGAGKTRLIGTNPSICYLDTEDRRAADLICASLPYAGIAPRIITNASAVHCRWLHGEKSDLFVVVNLTNVPAAAKIESEWDADKYAFAINWDTGEEIKIKKLTSEFTVASSEMLALEFVKK